MKVEIDTVKEEIIIIEATTAELLELCETYEEFTVKSKVEIQAPIQAPIQHWPAPQPYSPYNPMPWEISNPWYTTIAGNTPDINSDIINKEYFG